MIGTEKGQAKLLIRQDRVSVETVPPESLSFFVEQGNLNGLLVVGLKTLKATELDRYRIKLDESLSHKARRNKPESNTWSRIEITGQHCVETQRPQTLRKYLGTIEVNR